MKLQCNGNAMGMQNDAIKVKESKEKKVNKRKAKTKENRNNPLVISETPKSPLFLIFEIYCKILQLF